MSEILCRAAEFSADGRTLVGYAFRWDTPSLVSDVGLGMYEEAFVREAFDSFKDETIPLMYDHPLLPGAKSSPVPFGQVSFGMDDVGLTFRARVYDTDLGEAALADVKAGKLSNVSLSFYPRAEHKDGQVVYRTKVRPIELSLVEKGAHVGASVLAVRHQSGTPELSRLRRRLVLL